MNPDEMQVALEQLQREFPDAPLTEVRFEHRLGERHDGRPSEIWRETSWTVQVMNDHASGKSLDEAITELRKDLASKAQIPGYAERIAAILREIPDEAFMRYTVVSAAQQILEKERMERR